MRLRLSAYASVYLVIAAAARMHAVASLLCCAKPAYESLEELSKSWSPGHKIICLLPYLAGAMGFHHYMLVVDKEKIVHTVANSKGVFHVTTMSYKHISSDMIKKDCCRNKGYGIYGEEAVQRALSWNPEKAVYFNLLTCNCRHWVNYWAEGMEKILCPSYV